MFDWVGKRRIGYLFSGILTVICLVFMLATFIPNAGVGLQFSIAYTGGTVWEVHFDGETPDPADVRAVLEGLGHAGSDVAITGGDEREYVLIRTEALALEKPTVVDGSAAAAAASASPGAASAAPGSAAPAEPTAPAETAAAASVAPGASPAPDASSAPAAATSAAGDGPVAGVPTEGEFGALATALQERFGPIDEVRQQDSVGAVVSAELIQQTFMLIIFASLGIMGWISFRFRDVRMGVTAVVALIHDVIVTVGIFAILGTLIGLQVDALFVTAMLTVIGFSVHDTIVVFDRVRENRGRYVGDPLPLIVNHSITQTLGRSITTSLTLILTLMALFIFGGEAIRPFTLALLIGVTTGTYSSVFVAVPLFLDWHLWDDRRNAKRVASGKASPAKASPA
ncbi:MAG TPA: protein translocase subunit SecF [Candidatus Deferrimicrobium sp.]|nr:protein translocase subunit SecF [Candidatus Deferrimicrobium sp.]